MMFLKLIYATIIKKKNWMCAEMGVKLVRTFALRLSEPVCAWRCLWNVWLGKLSRMHARAIWKKCQLNKSCNVSGLWSLMSRIVKRENVMSVLRSRFFQCVYCAGRWLDFLSSGQWHRRQTPSCTAATSTRLSDTGRRVHQTLDLTISSTPSL